MSKLKFFILGIGVFLSLSVVSLGYADGRVYFTNNSDGLMTIAVEWRNGWGDQFDSNTVTLDPGQTWVFYTDASLHEPFAEGGFYVHINGGAWYPAQVNDPCWFDSSEYAEAVESSPTDWPIAYEKYTDSFTSSQAQDHTVQKHDDQRNRQIKKERFSR